MSQTTNYAVVIKELTTGIEMGPAVIVSTLAEAEARRERAERVLDLSRWEVCVSEA